MWLCLSLPKPVLPWARCDNIPNQLLPRLLPYTYCIVWFSLGYCIKMMERKMMEHALGRTPPFVSPFWSPPCPGGGRSHSAKSESVGDPSGFLLETSLWSWGKKKRDGIHCLRFLKWFSLFLEFLHTCLYVSMILYLVLFLRYVEELNTEGHNGNKCLGLFSF